MAQTDAFKKYLDAGMAFTQMTRDRAEQVVKDLVAAGELKRGQRKEAIDDLVERSRRNAEALAELVRKEVDSQLAGLGLTRKSDVDRLEAEIAAMKAAADPVAPAVPNETPQAARHVGVAVPVQAAATKAAQPKPPPVKRAVKAAGAGNVAASGIGKVAATKRTVKKQG